MADATKSNETNKNAENMERLFLLELLVDSVEVDYPKLGLDQSTLQALKQACVRFQFLNYPVLDICEEDFCNIPENYQKEKIEFKSGKSCLFSLRGIPVDIRSLDVCVTLVRQKEGGSCLELGKTRISLGSSFTNILTSLEGASNAGSISRTCKDTHPLFDSKSQAVGKITVFIRLTCFGKMIITQFQISGDENKSFLFKGAPEPKVEDYDTVSDPYIRENVTPGGDASRKIINSKDCLSSLPVPQKPEQPVQSPLAEVPPGGNVQSGAGFQGSSAFGMQPMPPEAGLQEIQNFPGAPLGFQGNIGAGFPGSMPGHPGGMGGYPQGGMGGYPQGGMGGYPQGGMGGYQQGGMLQFPGDMFSTSGGMPTYTGPLPGIPMKGAEQEAVVDNNFKEIGVEINGHSLTIKVPKRKKKTKVEEPQVPFCGKVAGNESSSESEPEAANPPPAAAPTAPDLNFCSCDIPLPPGFGVPPQPPQPKKKKKKKSTCPLELQGNYCLKPGCPMGYPMLPFPEKKCDQPQFQTPPGAIGLKGDQVIFQMPSNKQSGFDTNANAQYTFGGNPESNLQKVQMMTDDQAALPSSVNPLSDVFLLKVGKKNLETGKRSMMNVEVKSPRKEEKKMVDAQTQYIVDSPTPEKGEKVAKGKGKKKKEKKGKKK